MDLYELPTINAFANKYIHKLRTQGVLDYGRTRKSTSPRGEEEIVEEELALPDMTDLGGAQLEAVKQANEQSSGILGIANQVSGAIEDAAVNVRDFVDNTFQGDQRSRDQFREDRATIIEESRRSNEENI